MIEWVGYIAGFLTTACYVPQAMHVILTQKTAGISRHAYIMLFIGLTLWLIYGVLIGSWPIIISNGITLPLVGIILVMKLRHG